MTKEEFLARKCAIKQDEKELWNEVKEHAQEEKRVINVLENASTILNQLDEQFEKAEELIEKGFIGGGMLPKLKSCVESIKNGVNEVVILNGKVKYNLVSNFITPKKIGTTIGK